MTIEAIAHHEAAHAVITFRRTGASGSVTIAPANDYLGIFHDSGSDSFNPEHAMGMIVSCYAGGHAQRRIDYTLADAGCDDDHEGADRLLRENGWQGREQEFRDEALREVQAHWNEIAAVAAELLAHKMLDGTEVELIADSAAGDLEAVEALARYRMLIKRIES